ncbi:YidC/Oxa1 family membrane protein insertase [Patescibacteria group bacterium]
MKALFNTILYRPLLNLLIFLYNVIPGNDIGLAIIALTLLIKLILHPFSKQSIKAQASMQSIQPKINALKEKYKDNKEKMTQKMLQLYKDEKVNPFSSCLPLLLQFPFLIAVFLVFKNGLNSTSLDMIYPFIKNPGTINGISMGFLNLAVPSKTLAFLAGAAQFWQTKMMLASQPPKDIRNKEGAKDENMAAMMGKQMVYIMPLFTIYLGFILPGGLTLYFLLFSLLMGLQQMFFFKEQQKKPPVEEVKTITDGKS